MKKRRIFLAVNLPEQIKRKLSEYQRAWADLPVRWTKPDNLHITLVFIGYVDDEQMLEICQLTRQVAQKHQPFEIKMSRICLGPPKRPARMIWLEGEASPQLADLRDDLETALLGSAGSGFLARENRPFRPHITLARIRQPAWRQLPRPPQIARELSLILPVDSVEVMESHLSRQGARYAVLEKAELTG